jgi:hypothetical protein
MDAAELYYMYAEELDTEGIQTLPWEDVDDRCKIAWGKLARRLPREFAPRQAMLSAYPD